jgi:hypothetical protein
VSKRKLQTYRCATVSENNLTEIQCAEGHKNIRLLRHDNR